MKSICPVEPRFRKQPRGTSITTSTSGDSLATSSAGVGEQLSSFMGQACQVRQNQARTFVRFLDQFHLLPVEDVGILLDVEHRWTCQPCPDADPQTRACRSSRVVEWIPQCNPMAFLCSALYESHEQSFGNRSIKSECKYPLRETVRITTI